MKLPAFRDLDYSGQQKIAFILLPVPRNPRSSDAHSVFALTLSGAVMESVSLRLFLS